MPQRLALEAWGPTTPGNQYFVSAAHWGPRGAFWVRPAITGIAFASVLHGSTRTGAFAGTATAGIVEEYPGTSRSRQRWLAKCGAAQTGASRCPGSSAASPEGPGLARLLAQLPPSCPAVTTWHAPLAAGVEFLREVPNPALALPLCLFRRGLLRRPGPSAMSPTCPSSRAHLAYRRAAGPDVRAMAGKTVPQPDELLASGISNAAIRVAELAGVAIAAGLGPPVAD
jgi:hypothetical protein